jgi:hypothetical protein
MNPSNDKHFFDLSMRVISRQCSEQERVELAELIARQPELQAEFEQLRADAGIFREVAPLLEATDAAIGELPSYARERLQQHVKIRLPQAAVSAEDVETPAPARRLWWRWAAGFAGVAMVMGVTILVLRQNGFFSSWLDIEDNSSQNINSESPIGIPRFEFEAAFINNASITPEAEKKEQMELKTIFHSDAHSFSSMDDPKLKAWEADLPSGRGRTVVKLIYDRAGEKVQVIGRCSGTSFEDTFEVNGHDPSMAFMEAQKFIYMKIAVLQAK